MMPDSLDLTDLDALRRFLLSLDVLSRQSLTIEPLGGGMTNRNYLVRAGDGDSYVVRVAGQDTSLLGIDRDQEAACARAAADAGIAPEVMAYVREPTVLLTRFVSGQVLTTESLHEPSMLRRVAETLRRCHDQPAPGGASVFSAFEGVRSNHSLAKQRGVSMPNAMEQALKALARIEQEVPANEPPCLCHNDLLPANLIADDRQVWVIDWEYAASGDRFFDLSTLAANGEFDDNQEKTLLAAYLGEVHPSEHQRLKQMRRVSDLRESTWGYLQSALSNLHDPGFYQGYGLRHLERFLAAGEGLV